MTLLDLTGLTRLGNMTNGGGLDAIFDLNPSTSGYAESNVGWAGVSFQQPTPIDYVVFTSASNGFDASGATTPIELILWGKTGAAPSYWSDGVVLGVATFTDENQKLTKRVESSDKLTGFDHVWGRLVTGVWSSLSELAIFSPPTIPVIDVATTLYRHCNRDVLLTQAGAEVSDFRVSFELTEPRVAVIDFAVEAVHISANQDIPIGIGVSLLHKYGVTAQDMHLSTASSVPSAVGGCNIRDLQHHYGYAGKPARPLLLQTGWHQFSLWVSAHSLNQPDGLARILVEGGHGLNVLRVDIRPIGHQIIAAAG